MRSLLLLASSAILLLVPMSCSPPGSEASADEVRPLLACEAPRPEVCRHDFEPVCALLESGSRVAARRPDRKTYGNDCTACRDDAVRGYRVGSCEDLAERPG